MGNTRSTASGTEQNSTSLRVCESEVMDEPSGNDTPEGIDEEFHDADDSDSEARVKAREEEMEEFRKQLSVKREQRKEILARHRAEKEELEKALELQKKDNWELYEVNQKLRQLLHDNNIEISDQLESKQDSTLVNSINELRDVVENLRTGNMKLRKDLVETNKTLIKAYTDISELNAQNTEFIKHIGALKDVITVSKTMIGLREQQLDELKSKLREIEQSLAERESSMLSSDLRQEYERQLQNIRTLRGLYEERARLAEVTRQGLIRELDDQKALAQIEIAKCVDLRDKVEMLEGKINELKEIIENKEEEINASQDETRCLKNEMAVVNKLFSQVLLGYKTKQDLDKLGQRLEENHGILTQMAENEDGTSASTALPKLLLEIVSQVDAEENNESQGLLKQQKLEPPSDSLADDNKESNLQGIQNNSTIPTTAEEIVENLPKVWRVLMELLSHQTAQEPENTEPKVTTCYKSVETKSGPVLVPSVSQTYIRLKDLIVEKLGLIKEVNRMKQLNTHLESRLGEQEKRLCLVTTELSKTWHVVGRLRRHHYQLHTHEKILKYELQQKRKLLNELKEELEYCREKWEQAKEKNNQSERDWKKLRAEFSSRKIKGTTSTINTSAESGYSDERQSDDSSESIDESDHINIPLIKCKKNVKKSFETIVDSSSINVAEREDPVSDMIDVADLPLDAQEIGGSQDVSVSELCTSENVLNSTCDETEDEAGEITNESCIEETTSTEENIISNSSTHVNEIETILSDAIPTDASSSTISEQTQPAENVDQFDPKIIIESIRKQNLRLALRDRKLQMMEKKSASLLKQSQDRVELGNQINITLDHLLNRPTTSSVLSTDAPNLESITDRISGSQEKNASRTQNNTTNDLDSIATEIVDPKIILENIIKQNEQSAQKDDLNETSIDGAVLRGQRQLDSQNIGETSTFSTNMNDNNIDTGSTNNLNILELKTLLNNIKEQNAKLDHKDERLIKLEQHCAAVIANLSSTLLPEIETNTPNILGTISNDSSDLKPNVIRDSETNLESDDITLEISDIKTAEPDNNDDSKTNEDTEPSTSGSSTSHESRLAAREERLKRLEEQTKSLVNTMNKTKSKGVKINYKLEELHNIYGSEGPSRDGTPDDIDEDDDDSQVNDVEECNKDSKGKES